MTLLGKLSPAWTTGNGLGVLLAAACFLCYHVPCVYAQVRCAEERGMVKVTHKLVDMFIRQDVLRVDYPMVADAFIRILVGDSPHCEVQTVRRRAVLVCWPIHT